MTWFEVQQKLVAAQAEHMMCIHKQELTPLDVYHRILRYTNYMVAMVNKSLLPLRYSVPLLGTTPSSAPASGSTWSCCSSSRPG